MKAFADFDHNGIRVQDDRFAPLAIFSTNVPQASRKILGLLGVPFREVEGCWKGEDSPAFVIPLDYIIHPDVTELFKDQDAIVVLTKQAPIAEGNRTAYLVSGSTGTQELMGHFRPVSEEYARAQDGWTRSPDGLFWVANGEFGKGAIQDSPIPLPFEEAAERILRDQVFTGDEGARDIYQPCPRVIEADGTEAPNWVA